jgi:hypothetical protein
MNRYVPIYLAAIIAANVSVAHWGPTAAAYNAFLFVGLDLVCRDRLHDSWARDEGGALRTRRALWTRIAALVAAGSALSYALSRLLDVGPPGLAGKVAAASAAAFACAFLFDSIVYQAARHLPWLERSNLSNVAGAAADSVVFQTAAFGWNFPAVFAQFTAKVAGGFVWSVVVEWRRIAGEWRKAWQTARTSYDERGLL